MKIRLSHTITRDSIVDGPGLRAVIWTQGCRHNCEGCHNPSTHDFNGGFLMEIDDILEELKSLHLHRGITLSGGEPFEQPLECAAIAKRAKELGLDVWCYTGYTFEELIDKKGKRYRREWEELLQLVDVLVDGPFIKDKKNLLLKFRGSDNQRILDVRKSLKYKIPVLMEEYHDLPIRVAK